MNKAFRNTLRDIFGDGALIIFMVVVPIVYPLVYALIYNPETVHEVPVAVVDCAGTAWYTSPKISRVIWRGCNNRT